MGRILTILVLFLFIQKTAFSQVDTNPFNLYRTTDTSEISVSSPLTTVTEEITKLQGDNPFSISHIPIRKNQYKRIESLNIEKEEVSKKENISISYMPLWVVFFSLCLLAYMLFIKKNHLVILIKSMMNDNFLKLTNYEENGGKSVPYILGYVLFLINVALFIYLVLIKLFTVNLEINAALILAAISVFFVGKHIVNLLFSWVFEVAKETQVYDFTIITIRNILALIFLTLNILLVFGPDIWCRVIASFGALIFISFLISRYYKGLRIGRFYLNSYFFQFFLYFCAFEISPWVIIYKLVKDLN